MIVFPMAGLSSRFTRAGYEKPKYMLPLGEQTMFATVVNGFRVCFQNEPFLFICRDVAQTPAFIDAELAKMSPRPSKVQIIVLEQETEGQAETVYRGLQMAGVAASEPLTIFNIDSLRHTFTYPDDLDLTAIDGYVEAFHGAGEHWSFVKPAAGKEAQKIAGEVMEKKRISDLCSTGLYYFRETGLFTQLFEKTLSSPSEELQGGERYIAPLYNDAIQAGYDIRYTVIAAQDISFTGTPAEYEDYLATLQGNL